LACRRSRIASSESRFTDNGREPDEVDGG
jgi:hypothetical protein